MAERNRIRVGIVGASGYAGMDLIRLVLNHPALQLTYLAGNHDVDAPFSALHPQFVGYTDLKLEKYDFDLCTQSCDVVLIALPSGTSGQIAIDLWQAGKIAIDLSGDLRIPAQLYRQWYGLEPLDSEIQQVAVYGLPEWNRFAIQKARLISNPGCYPTATLLALLPVIRKGWQLPGAPIVVDAKSGVSGAGRNPKQNTQLAELTENFYAYKVGKHQHIPEIEYQLNQNMKQKIVFTAHLLPIIRGIFISAYLPILPDIQLEDIYQMFQQQYANEPFVHVLQKGIVPEMRSVRGSNNCQIGLYVDERNHMLQVFSVIDNLQKGAAGQALQNLNLVLGLPETMGLEAVPLVP